MRVLCVGVFAKLSAFRADPFNAFSALISGNLAPWHCMEHAMLGFSSSLRTATSSKENLPVSLALPGWRARIVDSNHLPSRHIPIPHQMKKRRHRNRG